MDGGAESSGKLKPQESTAWPYLSIVEHKDQELKSRNF
jgi:hypothetical protein